MAGLHFPHLLFVTITYVVLDCSHSSRWTGKLVYRPYGPRMCKELCKDSHDSLFFVLEDLSCNRISAPKGNFSDVVTCESDSAAISLAGMSNWDICYKKHNKTETHLGLNKAPTCSRDLKLVQNIRDIILHRACEEGRLAVVKYILAQGISDINCRGQQGRTPVMAAVSKGHAPVFDFLVSQRCNMSDVDDNNDNILHVACEGGNVEIVRKLVFNMRFDIESTGNHGNTPVLKTVYWGHMKLFIYLKSKGCNLKVVNKYGNNILHAACAGDHIDMAKNIVSMNIFNIDSKTTTNPITTPVMVAAFRGHINVFEFLVSKGCNLKVVDKDNNNILHAACAGGHVDMVKYIVSMNIFNIDSKATTNPVMVAAFRGHRKVFEFLVSKGGNLKVVDKYGNNILHLAYLGGHVDMVKHLLTLPALEGMEKAKNKHGQTPLMMARKSVTN